MKLSPLLVLVALVPFGGNPVAAVSSAPAWSIDDGAGDQTMGAFGGEGVSMPSNGAFVHGDLKTITIQDEDSLGVALVYHVAGLKVSPSPETSRHIACSGFSSSSSSGFDETSQVSSFVATFQLAGTPFSYRVVADVYGSYGGTDAASSFVANFANGYLCLEQGEGDRRGRPIAQLVDVTLDEATSSVRVWIPKLSLLGLGEGPFRYFGIDEDVVRPESLRAGDHLAQFEFLSSQPVGLPGVSFGSGGAVEVQDAAPDGAAAPDFVFQFQTANHNVALQLGDEAGLLPTAAGVNQTLPFSLTNRGSGKAVVKLAYAAEGTKAAGFEVTGPPSVTIPGGETRNFTLALKVPATARPEDLTFVTVTGESIGSLGHTSFARALVVPVPVLGPGASTLYFHGRPMDPGLNPFMLALCTAIPGACNDAFLSPLESDPLAGDPDRAQFVVLPTNPTGDFEAFGPFAQQFTGSPAAIAFDATQPIQLDVRLKTPSDTTGVRLSATIMYNTPTAGDGATLAEFSQTATIAASGTTVSMTAPVQLPLGTILPAGTRFRFMIEASVPASPGNIPAVAPGAIELEGGATRFTLPLVELPADLQLGATPSPFQISVLGDRQDFVNPGEGRLFNITLLNQGRVDKDAHIALDARPEGWTAKALPGADFRLKPGDTIRLGILLIAPADAKEGAEGGVWVNVTTPDAPTIGTRLAAISTTGVDLADDSNFTGTDSDARDRLLAGPGKDTPGVSALLAVGAIAVLAFRRRR